MTIDEAKSLRSGDIIHHKELKNADGTPVRYKVNGAVKTWKRDKSKIQVPLKHGLYEYGYLVNGDGYRSYGVRNTIDIADVEIPEKGVCYKRSRLYYQDKAAGSLTDEES